jgi:CheY-like chemotaxis protein
LTPRILVIDDSVSSRRKVVFALRALGLAAQEADGGMSRSMLNFAE